MTDTRTKEQRIDDMAKVVSKYRYPLTAEECKRIAQAAYTASGVEALREENERLREVLAQTNTGLAWLYKHIEDIYACGKWSNTTALRQIADQIKDNKQALGESV